MADDEAKGSGSFEPLLFTEAEWNRQREQDAELHRFADLFRREHETASDRALAIVGGAFLDTLLEYNLTAFLVDDPDRVGSLLKHGPLGNYSGRTKMAYCLGLIPATVREDLWRIGRVRNEFAHRLDATFAEQHIRQWCVDLKWHRRVFMEPPPGASARDLFYVGVHQLVGYLGGSVALARGERRKPRADPAAWD